MCDNIEKASDDMKEGVTKVYKVVKHVQGKRKDYLMPMYGNDDMRLHVGEWQEPTEDVVKRSVRDRIRGIELTMNQYHKGLFTGFITWNGARHYWKSEGGEWREVPDWEAEVEDIRYMATQDRNTCVLYRRQKLIRKMDPNAWIV